MTSSCYRPVKERMTRRCPSHDYSVRGVYMITTQLAVREPKLGTLEPIPCGEWCVRPSALGWKVLACWEAIPKHWPQVKLIAHQLMPDHFHGLLFVKEDLPIVSGRQKVLGDIMRGFKAGCREVGWQAGFTDSLLKREGQLAQLRRYIADNPRRLAEKRQHKAYFKVVEDLAIDLGGGVCGKFAGLGNAALANKVPRVYVQCSRRDFAYKHTRLESGNWRIERNEKGAALVDFETPTFKEKAAQFLEAVKKGAVLVSPCISHGEKEIIRRAFEAGGSVICLRNKGFGKLEKPMGKMFDLCTSGRLLLLAPKNWPYTMSKKPISREDALVLNTLAQLLAGSEVVVNYKGRVPNGLGALCAQAVNNLKLEAVINSAISGAKPNAPTPPSTPPLPRVVPLGSAAETRQLGAFV